MKNSKQFSSKSLNGFSRGFAYECLIPNIGKWGAPRTESFCTPSREPVDAFRVKSKSKIISWKKKIGRANSTCHTDTLFRRVDLGCIDQLASLNTRRIGMAFTSKPKTRNCRGTPTSARQVGKLQTLLCCERHDEILKSCDMSANERAALWVNRWLSSDHVCWLMKK